MKMTAAAFFNNDGHRDGSRRVRLADYSPESGSVWDAKREIRLTVEGVETLAGHGSDNDGPCVALSNGRANWRMYVPFQKWTDCGLALPS